MGDREEGITSSAGGEYLGGCGFEFRETEELLARGGDGDWGAGHACGW